MTKTQSAYANVPTTLFTIEQAGFAADGYEFVGWGTSIAETNAKYASGQANVSFSSNVRLYAIWKKKETVDPDPVDPDPNEVIETVPTNAVNSADIKAFNDGYALRWM